MRRIALAILPALALAESARALTVTINPPIGGDSFAFVYVSDGTSAQIQYLDPATILDTGGHTVAAGANASSTFYDISNSGFSIYFTHARTGTQNAEAHSYGVIYFSVDAAVDFLIEGIYTAADPDGRMVKQEVTLKDETLGQVPPHTLPGTYPFRSYQESRSTPNESFSVGLLEGDYAYGPVGADSNSPTGTLVAEHVYGFYWANGLWAYEAAPSSASASGFARLTFVPEPTTGALLAVGMAALGILRRRCSGYNARSA